MKRIYLFALLVTLLATCGSVASPGIAKEEIFATPEKSGGVLYAYPCKDIASTTPAPKGYQPFYISHFGRHGSRYLVSDSEYKNVLNLFRAADSCNALTTLGKDVLERLTAIWQEAEGNGGELTPLGVRQQQEIAERMYRQYPKVFGIGAQVSAASTVVGRCVHSMEIFCQRLSELNPGLSVAHDADSRHMHYLNYHTKEAVQFRSSPDAWRNGYNQFEKEHVHSDRLFKSLFFDDCFFREKTSADALMWDLYHIAGCLQNMQTDISLYDLFERQELFDLWQCKNYSLYIQYANAAENGGIMMENAKPLLRNIISNAKRAIETNGKGATLRFGHDGNIIPLAMLLHLEGCYNSVSEPSEFYKAWCDFKVAPMSANIQLVFFKSDNADDILVKFLHNENEILVPPIKSNVLPYYRWKDVVEFYSLLLSDF